MKMGASCIFFRGIFTSHSNGCLQKPLNPLRPLSFPTPSAPYVLDANNLITSHALTSASRLRRSSTTTTTTCSGSSATNAKWRSRGKHKRGGDADGDDGSAAPQNALTGGGHIQVATLISTAGSGAASSGDSLRSQNQRSRRNQRESGAPLNVSAPGNLRALYQNGDPLGRRDLGKCIVKWICQGMRAMASDFTLAEMQGEFSELRQRMGPGLTFVIQAQPYLNAVPMPLGLEAICLKVCTHYPTLFDHFQRELRDLLQDLQRKSLVQDWRKTESWQLLKELANSGFH